MSKKMNKINNLTGRSNSRSICHIPFHVRMLLGAALLLALERKSFGGAVSAFHNTPPLLARRALSKTASEKVCATTKLFVSASIDERTKMNKPTYLKRKGGMKPLNEETYDKVVQAAFVRHVLLETSEMADLAFKTLSNSTFYSSQSSNNKNEEDNVYNIDGGGSGDPFGDLARLVSTCEFSREEAGKVGWVDNPSFSSLDDDGKEKHGISSTSHLLPPSAVADLFRNHQPKGGDVHKIISTRGVHLIRVDDLMITHVADASSSSTTKQKVSTSNKVITNRKKLKGSGITPLTPAFSRNNENDGCDDTDAGKKTARTYHMSTTGCQMNVSDSERIEGVLQQTLNLTPTDSPQNADVVLLNTCSIRDHAEQKVYDQLGPLAQRKRRGEPVAVVVTGCVAQQEGEALLRRVPEVDLVMGPQYVSRIGELLEDVARGHQVVATDPTLIMEDLSRPVRGSNVRAWVNVIYGCNEHCTYCVVPGVRGMEQSRTMESMLEEILGLAEEGYKEVTLLGQNIDAYGRDMNPKRNFAELLEYLNKNTANTGLERIRYVTSHPRYFSDRVIDAVASLDKVMECFHMPFQSGDDEVLKNMRRGYTFNSYMKIINKIKKRAPDASICGDVIVGFPGETDEAFQHTLDLMEAVKFDNLNTFAYSPRPNTEASQWTNQVPEHVKSERLQIVQRLAAKHAAERSARYLGSKVEVMVEERNPRNIDQVMGRTRQGRQVFFDGDVEELRGKLVNVEITEARPWSLNGVLSL